MDGTTLRAKAVLSAVPMLDLLHMLGIDREIYRDGTQQIKCPLHDDRRPSARLYVSDGEPTKIFCFTCNKNFDVIDLARGKYGLTFIGAVEWLEAHFTVPHPSANLTTRVAAAMRQLPAASPVAMCAVADSAIGSARDQLGLRRASKAWIALDLVTYRLKVGRLEYSAAQQVVQRIVEVCR